MEPKFNMVSVRALFYASAYACITQQDLLLLTENVFKLQYIFVFISYL